MQRTRNQTITIARMTSDGIELAEQLRKSLRKDKIIVVGHSWGSILGVFMVKARPDPRGAPPNKRSQRTGISAPPIR
jgi:pimeloyl-ACP methyl ester carboxylesterase